ncbi:MAG: aminoacyl-tRNA hydrolase [Chloroflexi bacterium]|nr:aminoacyl-tRNA hydrolase [Chloroflexota bacterium]HCH35039.1 aminoacyl-tRNA hydrolase [Dehalococcoidia bacterium]
MSQLFHLQNYKIWTGKAYTSHMLEKIVGDLGHIFKVHLNPARKKPMVVVGLGNPGEKYKLTRHNVGFMFAELFADRNKIKFDIKKNTTVIGEGVFENKDLTVAKPRTFVNHSGQAVKYLMDRYRIPASSCLIIFDDMDLPVGQIRMRPSGGSGGHNGLNSISNTLGTGNFPRLRIGIGRPKNDTIDHVLSKFESEEVTVLEKALEDAYEATLAWVKYGIDYAMNKFN